MYMYREELRTYVQLDQLGRLSPNPCRPKMQNPGTNELEEILPDRTLFRHYLYSIALQRV